MKIVILLLFIILIFLISKNLFNNKEPYQDYGNIEDIRGVTGLSIQSAKIDDSGNLVFVLSDGNEIKSQQSVMGSKGAKGAAGLSINRDGINYDETTGNLSITLSNNDVIDLGNIKGNTGESKKGEKGPRGTGVELIKVDQIGQLQVTLDDGTKFPAGPVRGPKGADCQNIPYGVIVAWAGTAINKPDGWAICDGTNGTPDLSGRFIIGSSEPTYKPGAIGGEMEHTLSLEEIPNHKHKTPNVENVEVDSINAGVNTLEEAVLSVDQSVTDNTSDIIGHTGNVKPHNNMPPYFALIFIMKK
jgi:hypothetical protein